jgi:chlorophyll synthase
VLPHGYDDMHPAAGRLSSVAEHQPAVAVRRAGAARAGELALVVFRASRPAIWLTSIVPFYMGALLASHRAWPSLATFADMLNRATHGGLTGREFASAQNHAFHQDGELLLSFFVIGPLFWAAALLINDAYDVPGDMVNPRKADAPLVLGHISARWATGAAYLIGLAALAVSLFVSPWLTLVTGGLLVGAWAYSVPPLRLKTRPGADVVSNALGVGVLPLLGGWCIVRSLEDFPWVMLLLGLLVATALYVPTTLVDYDADREVGYTTIATTWGPRLTYWLGATCWLAANVLTVLLAAAGNVMPHRMLPILAVGAPLLLLEYAVFIGRPGRGVAVFNGLIVLSWTFLLVNVSFALMYGGMWVAN